MGSARDLCDQTTDAWEHYRHILQLVGRFTVAAPSPVTALRKLTVASVAPSGQTSEATDASKLAGRPRRAS